MPLVRVFEHNVTLRAYRGAGFVKLTIYRAYKDPLGVAVEAREAMTRATGSSWEVDSTSGGTECSFDILDTSSIQAGWGFE